MVAFDRNRFWYKNYILKEMTQYQESYIIGKDMDKRGGEEKTIRFCRTTVLARLGQETSKQAILLFTTLLGDYNNLVVIVICLITGSVAIQ